MVKTWFLALLPLLAAIVLYGYTVHVPFYLDDLPNFQIVAEGDGIRQWDGDPAFPYYRPMTFSVWKLLYNHLLHPAFYHWLNVLLFGATGVLIGQLTYQLTSKNRWTMGIAGLAFVIFPFNYQAVMWISSFFHILTGVAVCLCLWAALQWLKGRASLPILILVWLSAFVATFAHENGVLLSPLMTGLVILLWKKVNAVRATAVLIPIFALSAAYIGLRASVPHAAESYISRNVSPDFTAAYFLQGLAYPLHTLARRMLGYGEISPYIHLSIGLTVGAVSLALALIGFRARRLLLPALFGLGWYLAAAVPSTFFLELNYTLGSPRLMYISALGASIFWGIIFGGILAALDFSSIESSTALKRDVDPRFPHLKSKLRKLPVLLILVIPLLVSLPFLSARREEMLLQSRYGWRLIEVVESHAIYNDHQVMLVNAPAYLSPHQTTFLLGTEGSVFMLNGSDYNAFFRLNTNQPAANPFDAVVSHLESVRYEPFNFTPQNFPLFGEDLYSQLDQTDHIIVTYFHDREFYPVYVGGNATSLPDSPPLAVYPDIGLSLLRAEARLASDGQIVTILTRWQIAQPAPVRVFVHVFCGTEFIGQADGDLWGNLYPLSAWEKAQASTDIRPVFLDVPVDKNCLRLTTGVYRIPDIVRLSPLDMDTRQSFSDDVIPIDSITVSDTPFVARQ